MKKIMSILFLLTIPLITLQAGLGSVKKQKTINKKIEITEAKLLQVRSEFGNIVINAQNDDTIELLANITTRASNDSDAINLLEDILVEIADRGQKIVITTKIDRERMKGKYYHDISYKIDLNINIPKWMEVVAKNQFGDLTIDGSTGKVNLENSNGNLLATNLHESILTNDFGNVTAIGIQGNLDINNNNGITIVKKASGVTSINTRFSDININDISKDLLVLSRNGQISGSNLKNVKIENSFGDVYLETQNGDLDLTVHNGQIEAYDIVGNININNSFGKVSVNNIKGMLNVEAQNSRIIAEDISGNVNINTSYGKIEVKNVRGNFSGNNNSAKIIVENIDGYVEVNNQFGPINCNKVKGNVYATNDNADVVLSNIEGKIVVKTGFGDVSLHNILPLIFCKNSNGSISIKNIKEGVPNIDVQTSFGNINMDLNKNISTKIQLETSFGSISHDRIVGDIRTMHRNKNFTGIINEGTGQINCSGSSTNININVKE